MSHSELEIVTNPKRINAALVHSLLSETYWARERTVEQTELCLANSFPFAVFDGTMLVGFARVISDCFSLAYLVDVFVTRDRRGSGIGTHLTNALLMNPKFQSVKKWMLRTADAKSLYSRFGFELVTPNDTLMVLDRTNEANIE